MIVMVPMGTSTSGVSDRSWSPPGQKNKNTTVHASVPTLSEVVFEFLNLKLYY